MLADADDAPLVDDTKRASLVEIEVKKDIVYGKGGDEVLLLDLATPKGLVGPAPGIVWIHGGAWRGGSKAEFEGPIRESARAGYVAISIGYRLVPKYVFPARSRTPTARSAGFGPMPNG